MRSSYRGSIVILIGLALSNGAAAECKSFKELKIRNSFDGAKLEKKAASLAYENPDGAENYYNIDIAYSPGTLSCEYGRPELILYPTFEYHRSNAATEVRNASIGLKAEYFFGHLRGRDQQSGKTWLPFFLGDVEAKRDSANDTSTQKVALVLGARSFQRGYPGAPIRFQSDGQKPGAVMFRYYPYVGMETWKKLAIKKGDAIVASAVDESFLLTRLFVEWYPYRRVEQAGLQVTGTWDYRSLLGSSDVINETNQNLALNINYFFDPKGRVGIGFEYQNGRAPARNFLDEERSSIALKLKW